MTGCWCCCSGRCGIRFLESRWNDASSCMHCPRSAFTASPFVSQRHHGRDNCLHCNPANKFIFHATNHLERSHDSAIIVPQCPTRLPVSPRSPSPFSVALVTVTAMSQLWTLVGCVQSMTIRIKIPIATTWYFADELVIHNVIVAAFCFSVDFDTHVVDVVSGFARG